MNRDKFIDLIIRSNNYIQDKLHSNVWHKKNKPKGLSLFTYETKFIINTSYLTIDVYYSDCKYDDTFRFIEFGYGSFEL